MSLIDERPTAITRAVENKNFFLPVQSEFSIRRLPDVEFFCQAATIPGVAIARVDQHNPFTPIRHAGDVVEFDEFNVQFMVDEYLTNYMSVYDWILKLGFPTEHEQYASLSRLPRWSGEGLTSDCSVFFIDSKGHKKTEVTYTEAFPLRLSRIEVDSTRDDTKPVTATATFAYTKYEISKTNR